MDAMNVIYSLAVEQPTPVVYSVGQPAGSPALDAYGRHIDYLRLSLTDRCNLRCVYCMPEQGTAFLPTQELLTNEEIRLVVQAAAAAGFRKIRLTGGEPTLHHGLLDLIHHISQVPGIEHLAMTTNGLLLRKLSGTLKQAGLQRVNISIDTLDPHKFVRLTRGGKLEHVLSGIHAAERAGLHPVRLNTVIVRDFNDDEILSLAALTRHHPWELRFIEMMPLSGIADLAQEKLVSNAEVQEHIEAAFGPLEPLAPQVHPTHEPAVSYRIAGAPGTLGFISSISTPFCANCNRMRLTADGRLHLCLLHDQDVDLRTPLRDGASQQEVEQLIRSAVLQKPWGHRLLDGEVPVLRGMSQIGG